MLTTSLSMESVIYHSGKHYFVIEGHLRPLLSYSIIENDLKKAEILEKIENILKCNKFSIIPLEKLSYTELKIFYDKINTNSNDHSDMYIDENDCSEEKSDKWYNKMFTIFPNHEKKPFIPQFDEKYLLFN